MNLTGKLRLEIQKARSDVFVWGISTWTGYRFGGPADSATSGIEWLDVLGTSHDIKIQRGLKRDGVSLTLDAGMLTATVLDSAVDPNINPYFKPGTPLRLVFNDGSGDVPVFTGHLRQVQVTYQGKRPRVFLSAVDRTKELANISRSGTVGGTYANRVDDLLGKHGIPHEAYGSAVLSQNAFDSTLLEHLNVATTSAQGAFLVDKGNVVKAYGKDALLGSSTPALYFTDRHLTGTTSVSNLVPNPSYETSTSGTTFVPGTGGAGSISRVEGDAPSGGWFARGTWTTGTTALVNNGFQVSPIPVVAGKTYSAAVSVRTSKANVIALYVQYLNNVGSNIGNHAVSVLTTANQWTKIKVEGRTAPVGTVNVRLLAYQFTGTGSVLWAAGDTMDIDAFQLMEGETALDYFDGDNPMATWAGTVHNSVSTLHLNKGVEYTDIQVAYDSASLVNDLMIENLTYGLDEEMNPLSVHTKFGPYRNATSIATHGAYTANVMTNLPNEVAISDFAENVLHDNDAPELRIDSVTWNASERPEVAAGTEVFDTVQVEYTNDSFHIDDDFRVLALEHNISASNTEHKWTVKADLISQIGGM